MLLYAFSFLLGNYYLQFFAVYPKMLQIIAIVIVNIFLSLFLKKYYRFYFFPIAFILGFLWAVWNAYTILSWSLPKNVEGKPVLIAGTIVSLPTPTKFGLRFELKTNKSKVRLLWRHPPYEIKVGQKYQLLVRLKRIHSPQNPGTFDFEGWAFQRSIRATGYIIESDQNILLEHKWYVAPVDQFRQLMYTKLLKILPVSSTSHWLLSLTLGLREATSPEEWNILRATGTNHLMVIGGLHIGILAGFVYFMVSFLWRRIPILPLKYPSNEVGVIAALFSVGIYAAFAGFSIPTQRASIMFFIFGIFVLTRKTTNAWDVWSLALFMVLMVNPLSLLTESLWLSFGTIALIIYGMSARLFMKNWWWKWGRVQWVIGVGLIPLTLLFFQECSLISLLANSIAIPWMEFLILPFCLLGCAFVWFSPIISQYLLLVADYSLSLLWQILTALSHYEFLLQHIAIPNTYILMSTLIGILIMLLPNGTPFKYFGMIWLLPLFYFKPNLPKFGNYTINILDVGQGLSVHIQTKKHNLIYDTGPKQYDGFDAGAQIVVPYLQMQHVKNIDLLVISHGDNDHIGGAYALLNTISVATIKTSVPEKFKNDKVVANCFAGQSWQWDGVFFEFISPFIHDGEKGNNNSCVLRVDNGFQSILLTGDIEKKALKKLLIRNQFLKSNILIAPHHGSKTSGLKEFINKVQPDYVVYATGYRNRYHFPHPSVVANYKKINAIQLNTVNTGTISFNIDKGAHRLDLEVYRNKHKRYWWD